MGESVTTWIDSDEIIPDEAAKRTWIPRETWRQEKAVVFARTAIIGPHKFLAHDRSRAKSPKEHLWQQKRGVAKGTPDTQLIIPFGSHIWFEFKAPRGRVLDTDDQGLMLEALRQLGDKASWGTSILEMYRFWARHGVPMQPNAEFQALKYDGMVDSRIAKAEERSRNPVKSSHKAQPRYLVPKRLARSMNTRRMG